MQRLLIVAALVVVVATMLRRRRTEHMGAASSTAAPDWYAIEPIVQRPAIPRLVPRNAVVADRLRELDAEKAMLVRMRAPAYARAEVDAKRLAWRRVTEEVRAYGAFDARYAMTMPDELRLGGNITRAYDRARALDTNPTLLRQLATMIMGKREAEARSIMRRY